MCVCVCSISLLLFLRHQQELQNSKKLIIINKLNNYLIIRSIKTLSQWKARDKEEDTQDNPPLASVTYLNDPLQKPPD